MDQSVYQQRVDDGMLADSGTVDQIEMKMLDSMHFEKRVSFIKIDVEMYELQILRGAQKMLIAHEFPPMVFELYREGSMQGRRWKTSYAPWERAFLSCFEGWAMNGTASASWCSHSTQNARLI
jgi:hypothetical protein